MLALAFQFVKCYVVCMKRHTERLKKRKKPEPLTFDFVAWCKLMFGEKFDESLGIATLTHDPKRGLVLTQPRKPKPGSKIDPYLDSKIMCWSDAGFSKGEIARFLYPEQYDDDARRSFRRYCERHQLVLPGRQRRTR